MRLALALAALVCAAGLSSAQSSWDPAADGGGAGDSGQQSPDAPAQPYQPTLAPGPGAAGGPAGASAPGDNGAGAGGAASTGMSLGDARVNIGSIIHAFVDAHSRDGAWLLRDKKTKTVRRLSLKSIDENTTEAAGEQRYQADAALTDLDTGETLHAQFIADFSGSEWKVVGLRLFEPKTAKKKGARAAASASRAG